MNKDNGLDGAGRSDEGPKASPPEGPVTIAFGAGDHISRSAEQLVLAASAGPARGFFNDIELTAKPGDTAEQVVASYEAKIAASGEAYRKSPEGKAAAAKSAVETAELQDRADALIRALIGSRPELDFGDQGAVLDWLVALQPCSDRIGVKLNTPVVVEAFARRGLWPNMCCGADFDDADRDTVFKWLVGQALDGLANGPAIHSVLLTFADRWRKQFGTPQAATGEA